MNATLALAVSENGKVFHGTRTTGLGSVGASVDDLINDFKGTVKASFAELKEIRVNGTPSNAYVLTELHDLMLKRKVATVLRVYTPDTDSVDTNEEIHNLLQLNPVRQIAWASHLFDSNDYVNYAIINSCRTGCGTPLDKLLPVHPLYSCFTFLGTPTHIASRLITDIVDPRWYFNPQRPNRLSRLFSRFGLHLEDAVWKQIVNVPVVGVSVRSRLRNLGDVIEHGQGNEFMLPFSSIKSNVERFRKTAKSVLRFLHAYWLMKVSKHVEVTQELRSMLPSQTAAMCFAKHIGVS